MTKKVKSVAQAAKIKEQVNNKIEEKQEDSDDSSSSSLEDESSESFTSVQEDIGEEKELDISDALYLTDESEESEEPEYVKRKTLSIQDDFLGDFEELPHISDIPDDEVLPSITETQEVEVPEIVIPEDISEVAVTEEEETDTSSEKGRFVNPLTGSIEYILPTKETSEIRVTFEKPAETTRADSSTSSLIPVEIQDEVKPLVDDTLGAFLDIQWAEDAKKTEEINFEALALQAESKIMAKGILKFLNDVINKVVGYVEFLSPSKFLEKNLDKRKLMNELATKMPYYYREKAECAFLNRQATQHFRRKSSFRAITEDNPKTLEREKQKLEDAKERLNVILAKETQSASVSRQVQCELKDQYNNLKKEAKAQVVSFENRVKKLLHRENWHKLNADVEALLSLMKAFRNEINQVRFSLFLHQHNDKQLVELVKKMEDLGEGLTMKTFTNLQAENQSLDKKIKDRDTELHKLYQRCQKNIHTLAHYREKRQILNDTVKFQRMTLTHLTQQKHSLRELIFSFKLQRIKIHNKLTKLRQQGGILDKPALMLDYDQTIKLFLEKKENVNNLKRIMSSTQQKIDKLLQQCPAV